jgi:hypothetical protein
MIASGGLSGGFSSSIVSPRATTPLNFQEKGFVIYCMGNRR